MSDECISCKKKFGLFTQANIICDAKIELCDSCFSFVKKTYESYSDSIRKNTQIDNVVKDICAFKDTAETSGLSDDAKTEISEWAEAKILVLTEVEEKSKKEKLLEQTIAREYEERSANFIMTTTNLIEGKRIEKYIGIVSGEAALGTGVFSELCASTADFFGVGSEAFADKLSEVKAEAISRLKRNALLIGATGVVGVDINLLITNANMIIACANGTAVVLENCDTKEKEGI